MLPFYLLGICVYAGLKLVFPFVSPLQRMNYNIVTILPNALLLNDLCPWAQNNVVPGGWSISCMMIFAVGFPAFIWFLKEGALVKSIGLTILGVLVSVLLFIGFDLPKEYCLLFFTTQLAPFLVGILLHQYKAEVTQLSRKPILCLMAFFGLVLLTALCVKVDCYAFLYRQVLMAIAFGALVCAAQAVAKYPKSLLFVGRHSYSIYLFHFAVIWMISR